MITEDYVSFETAKLLKEKGFDDICRAFYYKGILSETNRMCVFDKCTNSLFITKYKHWGDVSQYITAPTLQMAMKWLREVHKVDIDIRGYWGLTPEYHIKNYMFELHYANAPNHSINEKFSSYEQACEAAIKYCLENLI